MTERLFRDEALLFAGQRAFGDVLLTQPMATRVLTGLIAIIVALVLVYLWTGEYARKETVVGYLDPNAGVVNIYPSEPGTVVQSMLVAAGDEVAAGQPLIKVGLESINSRGENTLAEVIRELESQRDRLHDKIKRHDVFYAAEKLRLQEQVTETRAEISQQEDYLSLQEQRVDLAIQLLDAMQKLREIGAIPEVEWLQALSDKYEQEKEVAVIKQRLIQLNSTTESTKHQLAQLPHRSANEKQAAEMELSEIEQRLVQVLGQKETVIVSPVAGRVSALQAKVGSATRPGVPLLSILPADSELVCVLLIPSSSIGFIEPGQEIKLKFDAYPYQQFGIHPAELISVSETPVKPEELLAPISAPGPVYVAHGRLRSSSITVMGEDRLLQPGMLISSDIILEQRTFLDWLLAPLHSI